MPGLDVDSIARKSFYLVLYSLIDFPREERDFSLESISHEIHLSAGIEGRLAEVVSKRGKEAYCFRGNVRNVLTHNRVMLGTTFEEFEKAYDFKPKYCEDKGDFLFMKGFVQEHLEGGQLGSRQNIELEVVNYKDYSFLSAD